MSTARFYFLTVTGASIAEFGPFETALERDQAATKLFASFSRSRQKETLVFRAKTDENSRLSVGPGGFVRNATE